MTYAEVDTLVNDATFQVRVKAAIQEVSRYIMAGPAVVFTPNQITNAYLAARNPNQFVSWFSYQVAMDSGVQASVTDATVKAAVDTLWPKIWA